MEEFSAPTLIEKGLDRVLETWLRAGAGASDPCERVIETSISWVFLFRDRALKIKKPVNLGFLDFTTLRKRHWAAERELTFNRLTAPDIYRSVRSICRDGAAGFVLDGGGELVEWALEMRRFDETAVLSQRPQAVDGDFAEAMGRMIAQFHIRASPGSAGGGAAGLVSVLRSNAHHLRALSSSLGIDAVERLIAATTAAFESVSVFLDRRAGEGFVRCCHGDLHLGNILMENGAAVLFDCVEFNDAFREIDVLYDLAFLLMDLDFRNNRLAANRVLNGWLDEAARGFDTSFWEGLAALPLFQSVRAAVRAHVSGRENNLAAARRYLARAESYLHPSHSAMVAVGGVSGSGKSTIARALAPRLRGPAGAIILRSDEVRKRLWARDPTEKLPLEAYTPESHSAVYVEMLQIARKCLGAGCTVVADAVFLRPDERDRAEQVAADEGATFEGIWLEAPPEILRERLARRKNDASDADAKVLSMQLAQDPGPIRWRRSVSVDARATIEDIEGRLGVPKPRT